MAEPKSDTGGTTPASDADELQQLRDENAALRARLGRLNRSGFVGDSGLSCEMAKSRPPVPSKCLVEPVRFHRRSFRLSPVTLVELRPNLGNAGVFRVPEPVRLLVRLLFYRSFYRVPRVGNPKGEVVVKGYVAKKGDRWYAVINEGLASRPGT